MFRTIYCLCMLLTTTVVQAQRPSPLLRYKPETLAAIDKEYQKKVLPVFRKACFDCHSMETEYPWFYQLPKVKEFIDVRILEAREDVVMKRSFPFTKIHDPLRVLGTIKHVVAADIMPRFEYQIIFWRAFLSPEEKQAILDWTDRGISGLSADLVSKATKATKSK